MPKYSRPAFPIPLLWPTGQAYKETAIKPNEPLAADIQWQEFFLDPKLQKVLELALANNRDLRAAALTVDKTRAIYQIQTSYIFPTIDASGTFSKQRVPGILSQAGQGATVQFYNLNLGLTYYEVDLFGRIRSLKENAFQEFLATEHARRSVQIILVAEVADTYVILSADRERLKLAQDTLKAQQASYDLIRNRFERGTSSELDLYQAQTRLDAAKVDIARFISKVAQDENALNFLVGSTVPKELMSDDLAMAGVVKDIAVSLPSEVLQRRPDILEAESQLKAANANIGAARANFFPRITLSTSIGTSSEELSNLFGPGSGTWAFVPQFSVPVFDAGRNKAFLRASEIDRDIFLAQYEKAIQAAFREVADALAERGTLEDQMDAQQSLVNATMASYRLSEARYLKGIDSYLNALDAQRSLYASQQDLITVRLERIVNSLTLYKVLGGGWNAADEKAPDEVILGKN
jgi:outer membrane protein, multidrug efflux system